MRDKDQSDDSNISITDDLMARAVEMAKHYGISLDDFIIEALQEKLAESRQRSESDFKDTVN